MKAFVRMPLLCMGALSWLSACKPAAEPPPAATAPAPPVSATPTPTLMEAMTQSFTPQSNKLWELAGNLYGANGELDASLLNDAQWQELAATATAMRDVAAGLADSTAVKVAAEGVKIQSEGAPGALGATQVQALIDGNPDGFRQDARQLVAVAEEFMAAATAHDATRADAASTQLNEACTACHNTFWYPGQQP